MRRIHFLTSLWKLNNFCDFKNDKNKTKINKKRDKVGYKIEKV